MLVGRSVECARLDGLLAQARDGRSAVLVLRGEPGIGKTALFDHAADRAESWRIVRAAGVESEMELPFAGLHQLCAPLLDGLERLPPPQHHALATAFGLSLSARPDRFLVGLAVLGLLSQAAEQRPVLCLVDDAHWLDRCSAQVLPFVARRLRAESVVMLFAEREPDDVDELARLPDLWLEGVSDRDARVLLDSALLGPVDERVRDRIVAETRGNPLALLELPRALTPEQLAGGFGLADPLPLASRIEQGFLRRLEPLPLPSRRLLLTAAAEPVGDVTLLWRALERLGIGADAAAHAKAAGLIDLGARVRFRHPLVRSAVYRSAGVRDLHEVHGALADATDPAVDPDRRAWHRAHATPAPDEAVAAEVERSADRAQARGGLAATAAFLEQAAALTPDPDRRARRALAAARAKRDAGALDAALDLLAAVEAGPPDTLRTAEVERLRGEIALDQRRGSDAARLLLSAARRLEPLNAPLARETHLEALAAALWATDLDGQGALREAAEAARAAPAGPQTPRAVDLVLEALAVRITEGYAAAAPTLRAALEAVRAVDVGTDGAGRWRWLAGNNVTGILALEAWDCDARHVLGVRQVRLARESGALVQLQFALNFLANAELVGGDLAPAAALIDEDGVIAEATGNPPVGYGALALAAFRGREDEASRLIGAAVHDATARGHGRMVGFASYAGAVLHNGLGRHEAARDAAWRVFERDVIGYGTCVVAELAEAASRTGDLALVEATLAWMSERTRATPSEWALGIEARIRALVARPEEADALYGEAIQRLGRTRLRAELARTHLLYGEWLRRQSRRVEGRAQLRAAHLMLTDMGMEAFAARARRELLATGEVVRRRSAETVDELTAQEAQIARLAGDGRTNVEIGVQLFLSARTVEWHLRKVFAKLGISSRKELRAALPEAGREPVAL